MRPNPNPNPNLDSPRRWHAYPTGFVPQGQQGAVGPDLRSQLAPPHKYPDKLASGGAGESYDYQESRSYREHSLYDPRAYLQGAEGPLALPSQPAWGGASGSGVYMVPMEEEEEP